MQGAVAVSQSIKWGSLEERGRRCGLSIDREAVAVALNTLIIGFQRLHQRDETHGPYFKEKNRTLILRCLRMPHTGTQEMVRNSRYYDKNHMMYVYYDKPFLLTTIQ